MANILFAGGEVEAFNRSSTNVQEDNGGSFWDTSLGARCAILLCNGSSADWLETPGVGSQTTFGLHVDWHQQSRWSGTGATSGGVLFNIYDHLGTAVFRLKNTSATNDFSLSTGFQMQYWNGSAWTNIGGTFTLTTDTLLPIDVALVQGVSGSAKIYVNNSLVISASADLSAIGDFSKVRFLNNSTTGSQNSHVSDVILADGNTVGYRYYIKPPNGNSGTNTAWTNDNTAVNEMVLSDTNFIESTSAGDVETYTHAAWAGLTSGAVKAVVISARALASAGGPQNLKGALRIGGTNYFSANVSGLTTGYGPVQAIFANDPSTSAAWTLSAAGSTSNEFGVQSAA